MPNTIALVMLAVLVIRAAGESEAYLGWAIFAALVVSGAGMILHAFRFRYLGSGRLIVTNFNVPFLTVCALALHAGGPRLLASLLVASTLLQLVLTLRLASLRRVFTQTVSGVVVMLVAASAMPFVISTAVVPPEGASTMLFMAPGVAALIVGVFISLQGTPAWRMWILPATVAAGLVVAVPLGYYDTAIVIHFGQGTLKVRPGAAPNIGTCVYAVSKLSIRAFAKYVAEEEREFNICVLSMGPGSGGGDERPRETGAGIPGGGGGIVTEDSPQWARESPRPAQVESVGDRYVLAAQAGMEFSGCQVTVRDGALAIVED